MYQNSSLLCECSLFDWNIHPGNSPQELDLTQISAIRNRDKEQLTREIKLGWGWGSWIAILSRRGQTSPLIYLIKWRVLRWKIVLYFTTFKQCGRILNCLGCTVHACYVYLFMYCSLGTFIIFCLQGGGGPWAPSGANPNHVMLIIQLTCNISLLNYIPVT